jgi:hypothetical protein
MDEDRRINDFCYCGLPAVKEVNGHSLCRKHIKAKIKIPKRDKELHGKSKSVNRFYNYE